MKQITMAPPNVMRLLFGALAAVSVARLVRSMWPEARRYLRMKQM